MILAIVAGVVIVLLLSLRWFAHVYTDYLWYQSLDASAVWQRRLATQGVLATVFCLIFLVLAYVNMEVADRLAPPTLGVSSGDELIDRYRAFVQPRRRAVQVVVSVVFALIAGLGAIGQWQNWLLFRFGKSFGVKDPLHNTDVSFYVFKLPFLSWVLDWAFASMLLVLFLVVVLHYLNGGIRLPGTGPAVSGKVKAHLSVILAVIALIKAADYWFDRARLTLSNRGVVTGALYADVHAQLPATTLLIAISVFCALLFIINIRQRGWGLPIIAVSLWLLMAVMAGTAYPWFIHRFTVLPVQSEKEAKYIKDNIRSTRDAFGLNKVKERNFDYKTDLSDEAVTRNADTVGNIRLLDPGIVQSTYQILESKLDFFGFRDLDVDRYQIDGKNTQVVIGARELDSTKLPTNTWEAKHLSYTHGYGIALAPANGVTTSGLPDFLVGDIPISNPPDQPDLDLKQPEIYFGEHVDGVDGSGYAIVGTKVAEQGNKVKSNYTGGGGVALNSTLRRAAFALRFGEIEPLISNSLTDKSRILFNRNVNARVTGIAPFVKWDSDPYPVIADGRLKFVIDGYTTASTYPYSQAAITNGLPDGSDLKGEGFNYLRNSVKAVVDSYDGTLDMYLADELYGGAKDPVIRAYAAAFPGLFQPTSKIPKIIKEHLRYPEDMFRVQTSMWGRYHISDPKAFYRAEDNWDVAQNPPSTPEVRTTSASLSSSTDRIAPYYLLMKLPQSDSSEFLIFRPFVQHSDDGGRRQLSSFMVGKSDPDDFGTLEVFTMTTSKGERNREVDGPLIAHQKIVSDVDSGASKELTLLNGAQGGSKVEFGNMMIVPIDEGLMYVRPLYLRGDSSDSPPVLREVFIDVGGKVAFGKTLTEAIHKLFPTAEVATREAAAPPNGSPPTTTTPGATTSPPSAGTETEITGLISRAIKLFDEADQALKSGGVKGLSDYQDKTAQAEDLIRQANEALSTPTVSTTVPDTSGSTTTTTTK